MARIAELEQTVQAQQVALAEHEEVQRHLSALRHLVADQTEALGQGGDQPKVIVSHEGE